jgi:hypothetical protein
MPSRDLILTTLHRVRFETAAAFFISLRRTGYQGRIVVFASALDNESVAKLRAVGASIVPFRFTGTLVRQRLAGPWPIWRWFFASKASAAAKEWLAHLVFHLFYRRHLLYLQYLREHRQNYDRVFLTDCRDVYFQSDPFSWDPPPGIHFFLEEPANKIGQCPHHIRWINSQFGQATLKKMSAETVSCAGTTFGDMAGITEYLAQMVSLSMKALSLREIDGDQGIHNYILRERILSRVIVHENRRGPVMTLGPIKMGDIRLSADRQVVNEAGQVVSVLHQYDRIPELKRILLDRVALLPE